MKNKSLKERIEENLMALDFESQRMSESGNIAYRELSNIVINLYNNNIELNRRIKRYEDTLNKMEEEL